MTETAFFYWNYYQSGVIRFWHTLGPQEYSTILLVVAIVGWLSMKSNLKRA